MEKRITVEITEQDVLETLDNADLAEFEDVTVQVERRDLVGKLAVTEKVLAQVEGRAAWHMSEATRAELVGNGERAKDERDSFSDLNAYAKRLRRGFRKAPPPTPWDRETGKYVAMTKTERRFFGE